MKRFLRMLLLCSLPLLLTVGTTSAYYYFCIHPQLSGDLGFLGGIPFGTSYLDSLAQPRLSENRVVEYRSGEPCVAAVVTIGDSFSHQGANGYQNFMAHAMNTSIVNFRPAGTPLQSAVSLLNSGFLESSQTPVVVVEVAERHFVKQILEVDFSDHRMANELLLPVEPAQRGLTTSSLMKYTYNWLMLQVKRSPVHRATLSYPLFTLQPQTLYFYSNDLDMIACSDDQVAQVAQRLERLHSLFSQHGVRLVVVVAADKYDMYQQYIVDNPYPEKTVMTQLSTAMCAGGVASCDDGVASCDALYIDTRALLAPLLKQGVRDLYMANDTHWSQVGAEVVGEYLTQLCVPIAVEK